MEEELLHLLQTQPEQGFKLLVKKTSERMYWHIRRIVLNHEDANDLVQEVYIKVYKNLKTFRGDSKVYTWLYRIATNESLNFLNSAAKRKNMQWNDYAEYAADKLESDTYYDGKAGEIMFQKALATLPEKQRMVFQLKYFEHLKYREIAEILQQSEGALKANYHHATKKIESYIKQNEFPI